MSDADHDRGDRYQARFDELAASGADVHGEASFVHDLGPGRVLDAGCGTGRVAVELARRGIEVVGVDVDPEMLAVARRAAPSLDWREADLADLPAADLPLGGFDVVVLAGNVMIFLEPGTEAAVLHHLADVIAPGGALVAGFQLQGRLSLERYDALCDEVGLELAERWATWDRRAWDADADYAVSVHRRRPDPRT